MCCHNNTSYIKDTGLIHQRPSSCRATSVILHMPLFCSGSTQTPINNYGQVSICSIYSVLEGWQFTMFHLIYELNIHVFLIAENFFYRLTLYKWYHDQIKNSFKLHNIFFSLAKQCINNGCNTLLLQFVLIQHNILVGFW